MFNKLFVIAAAMVTISFVFVSIAHACSDLISMNPAVQENSMNIGPTDDSPCGEEKPPDICKFVRDAMLSVKPTIPGLQSVEKSVSPPAVSFSNQHFIASALVALMSRVSFHPVFKLSLSFSYRVLRI
jgi:hypothetical protein